MASLAGETGPKKSRLGNLLTSVVTLIAVLVIWEVAVDLFNVSRFILPPPSDFIGSLYDHRDYLTTHSLHTLEAIVVGYLVGAVAGLVLGILIGLVPVLERSIYYVIVFVQTMPKVAIAPLLVIWMGHGLAPKVVLIAVVTFVPILIDAIAGMKYIDRTLLLVSRSMGASFVQTLLFIRLPAAIPHLLSGFKTSLVIAVTVAVVVEFVAGNSGLGFVAVVAMGNDDLALVFAAIVVVATMGLILSGSLELVDRWAMPWKAR